MVEYKKNGLETELRFNGSVFGYEDAEAPRLSCKIRYDSLNGFGRKLQQALNGKNSGHKISGQTNYRKNILELVYIHKISPDFIGRRLLGQK